ncbi:hypothetical protein BDR06DRAFT_1012654 [Suillus hirtellus]|nr:hypothetical protein BDR06DRAFT_1012654 [Suillus hirtellus]
MIGHLKAHVYNLASLAVVEDTYSKGTLSINEDELPPKHKSAKVSADTPDAMKVDLDALKGGITALFKEFGGKLTVHSGNFPWKKLCSDLDHQGFIIEGYPEDILMPGETHSTNTRSKGINDLDKRKQIILAEALKSGMLVIKHRPTGPEVKDNSQPVIIEEAPPLHSIHLCSQQLLANGIMDCEGPSHLQLSAATTKARKSNGSVSITPPIVIKNNSPTSAIVCQKNIIVSVDIPLAHPFKVVRPPKSKVTPVPSDVITLNDPVKAPSGSKGDHSEYNDLPQDDKSDYEEELPSRRCKARTIGSTCRLKCHVPSSDIELIEQLQPKGKGKETVLQKERARVHYHELTSDSEEEKKEGI